MLASEITITILSSANGLVINVYVMCVVIIDSKLASYDRWVYW